MDIKIGNFQITADGIQFILFKKQKKGEKADNPGEEFYAWCGYYSDFVSCLKEIPRHALLRSDCTTFEEVLYILRDYKRMINAHLKPDIVKEVIIPKHEVKMLRRTK
jgi:hypothetical protein